MPFVDDVSDEFHQFIDAIIYDIIKFNAEALWWLIKSIIILSYQIISVDEWLSERAFPPLIQGANEGTRIAATMTFVIALMVLGLTYLLAVWIRLDVVSPRKAFLWFLAGALFFQVGPQLYQGFHDLRTRTASIFFMSGTRSLLMAGGDPFSGFSAMTSDDPLVPYDLCDNRDPYFDPTPDGPGDTHVIVRGSDVTLAFLRATGYDVMGYAPPYPSAGGGFCGVPPYTQHELPQWWMENPWVLGGYFYEDRDSSSFGDYGENGRRDSIEYAFMGLRRLMAAIPLAFMGVMEALVYLLLTVAEGMTFLSFSVAIVFSYFRRTEGIALSIIDLMVQLLIQTIAIGLFQALIMGFAFSSALSGNGYLMLGIGLLTTVLMLVLLWSGVKAVFNSFNRLFQTMGQAMGNVFVTPTQGAMGALGMGMGGGLAAASAVGAGTGLARASVSRQPRDVAQQAMQGSGNMLRAGAYAMAAGTGNGRIMQAAQFSSMMTRRLRPRSAPVNDDEPQTTMTQVSSRTLAAEVQSVGEELEQEVRLNRVADPVATTPQASSDVVREIVSQLRSQRGPDAGMTSQAQINAMMQGAGTTLGRYIQQALQLGLNGPQAAGVLRAVQGAENGQLSLNKQQTLVGYVQQTTGQPREWVERDVSRLTGMANAVPRTVQRQTTAEQ